MDCLRPIYSQKNQCQDCYRCLRQCPVKAIRIVEGSATVVPERCIVCGHCVGACSFGAKQVRNDLRRARHLLQRKQRVVASLAPSFVSEFPNATSGQLVRALELLGFAAVSETALGAEEVSASVAELLAGSRDGVFLSSACPVAVDYVRKYHPGLADRITPVLSPLLAHCKLLRRELGEEIGVVFVGPCIGKKVEADRHPDLLDVALTFEDLRAWLAEAKIVTEKLEGCEQKGFSPRAAGKATLYPLVGGMNATLEADPRLSGLRLLSASGMTGVSQALRGLESLRGPGNVFVELLACEGGCVNGPKSSHPNAVASQLQVHSYADRAGITPASGRLALDERFAAQPLEGCGFDEAEIRKALWRLGKERPEDELNCSGCGYNSCRELACALLAGMAEESMCVSYMRRLAHKKANALMRSAPFGVVLADEQMKVVDCNEHFARLLGPDYVPLFEALPGLVGVDLDTLVPFPELFARALDDCHELVEHSVALHERLLNVTLFSIEPHRVVGAILQDVTQIETRREEVVQKARQVIQGTLTTVQEIAFRLGKNAADSEVILNSIIDCFGGKEPGSRPDDGGERP